MRWLGGPEWPAREFAPTGSGGGDVYRGLRVLRSHSWVAFDDNGAAVAHIGGEVYDRWCRYNEGPDGPVIDAAEVADVVLFAAGIETGDVASARCAVAAGLLPRTQEPDWEDIVYHIRRRVRTRSRDGQRDGHCRRPV